MIISIAIKQLAKKISSNKLATDLIREYAQGKPPIMLVKSIISNTKTPVDDGLVNNTETILAHMMNESTYDIVDKLAKRISIPDMDTDPANNLRLNDIIDKLVKEILHI